MNFREYLELTSDICQYTLLQHKNLHRKIRRKILFHLKFGSMLNGRVKKLKSVCLSASPLASIFRTLSRITLLTTMTDYTLDPVGDIL